MLFRRNAALLFGAVLFFSATLACAQATTVHGKIESLTKSGEIEVDGHLAQITPSTVIATTNHQPIAVGELRVGMTVDMSLEDGPRGTDAVSITASILR